MIFGERRYAMRVWLDPARLAARGLTTVDVTNALAEQNVEIPAGQVGQPPSDSGPVLPDPGARRRQALPIRSSSTTSSSRAAHGGIVQLKDVGYAEVGAETYSTDLRYNGATAIGVGVAAVEQRQRARRWTARPRPSSIELSKSFPAGLNGSSLRHHDGRGGFDPGSGRRRCSKRS